MTLAYLDSYRLMTQARGTLERTLSQCLAPLGLTLSQFTLLDQLVQHKTSVSMHLSQQLGISLSGVTTLVDQLERKQWLERLHQQPDRRRIKLSPTPAGSEVHARATALLARLPDEAERVVPGAYFEALNVMLRAF